MLPSGQIVVYHDGYRTDCILTTEGLPPCARLPGLHEEIRHPGTCSYRGAAGFGALRSADLRSWDDVTGEVSGLVQAGLPSERQYKHGTAVRLPREALLALCLHQASRPESKASRLAAESGLFGHCPKSAHVLM